MNAPMRGAHLRRQRGISAVEFAIAVNVLILIVLGIIEFARMGMAVQLLTNASRDGCRVAVIQNMALSDVQTRVNATLAAAGISPGTITAVDTDPGTNGAFIIPSTWSTSTGNTPITVVLRMPYTQVSWLPAPLFLKSATIVGTATLNNERP